MSYFRITPARGPFVSYLLTAAARLLLRRKPPESAQVLLDYVPFADDSAVEDEVLSVLSQLAVQDAKFPGKGKQRIAELLEEQAKAGPAQ